MEYNALMNGLRCWCDYCHWTLFSVHSPPNLPCNAAASQLFSRCPFRRCIALESFQPISEWYLDKARIRRARLVGHPNWYRKSIWYELEALPRHQQSFFFRSNWIVNCLRKLFFFDKQSPGTRLDGATNVLTENFHCKKDTYMQKVVRYSVWTSSMLKIYCDQQSVLIVKCLLWFKCVLRTHIYGYNC